MKYQVLFSLKNNEIFMNVVCCSCDRSVEGYIAQAFSLDAFVFLIV